VWVPALESDFDVSAALDAATVADILAAA
jgi:hypothetical protein